MLNVIISDSVKDSMMKLASMVKAIIKANQIDADIKFLTLKTAYVLKAPIDPDDSCLFILKFSMEELDLFQKIGEIYKNSFILFFADIITMTVLKASLKGNIRPSGFMEKPIQIKELQSTFMEIYADYLNRLQDIGEVINVSVGCRVYMLCLNLIIYFETLDKKVNIVTKDQCISYYNTLYSLEKKYSESFVRCHKSYLVNVQMIKAALFDEMLLVMENDAKIPISRTYKNHVKEILQLTPKNMRLVRKY